MTLICQALSKNERQNRQKILLTHFIRLVLTKTPWHQYTYSPLGTPRVCDVESTSMKVIQRRNNVVCPVGVD